MAISNTNILIKRSSTTGTPSSLRAGEMAYSYLSNTIFIGSPAGTGVVNVGGQYYTSQIDNATSSNTVNALVKRDASGNISVGYITAAGISVISADLVANTAVYAQQLANTRNFSASGDASASAVGFNGTQNVDLSLTLTTVNSQIGTYGNTTTIPSITVDGKGRITAISNNTIATSFSVSGNTGSGSQNGGGTLSIVGNNSGVTTTVTGTGGSQTVSIGTDSSVARTNTAGLGTQVFNTELSIPTSNVNIGGILTVSNLVVSGNVSFANVRSELNVSDPIIYLASNNSGNAVDIGFVGHIIGTGHEGGPSKFQHTGFVRDYNDNKWKLFSNVSSEVTSIVDFSSDAWYDTIKVGGVDASSGNLTSVNAISANSLTLTNALGVTSGGTGAATFTTGGILVGSGTNALTTLANSSYSLTGELSSSKTITSLTVDVYGRVTDATGADIAIGASQVTSGTLAIAQGGTNSGSFTTNQITYYNGTSIVSLANTGTAGTYGSSTYIPIITTDGFGRISSVSNTAISGLNVSQGGTGASTFSSGQLLIGNGTGTLASLANTSYTQTGTPGSNNNLQSITVDTYGRVTAATFAAISGLTVSQGGTGLSTATINGITYGNGTAALGVTAVAGSGSDQTWSNQILTVTNAGVPTWSSAMDGGTF